VIDYVLRCYTHGTSITTTLFSDCFKFHFILIQLIIVSSCDLPAFLLNNVNTSVQLAANVFKIQQSVGYCMTIVYNHWCRLILFFGIRILKTSAYCNKCNLIEALHYYKFADYLSTLF